MIKTLNITFVLIRKKTLLSIHSVLNKLTGAALFLFPLTLPLFPITYSVAAICALATVAATQEVYFVAKGQVIL